MDVLESVCVSFIAVIIPGFKSAAIWYVYYHLFSSVKTDTPLFVVMQNHLFSWRIKLLVLSELGDHDNSGISLTSLLAFMVKSCLYCSFLVLSHNFFNYKSVFLYELVLYNPLNLPFAVFPCFALTMPLSSTYHLWVPAVSITLCRT